MTRAVSWVLLVVSTDHACDAEAMEALALREGLHLAHRLACYNLVIQSDCMAVVEALNSNGAISSVGAPIIEDCQDFVKDLGKVIVQLCYRESNKVAHELASFGRDNPPAVWLDIPPSFLLSLIVDDVTIV
jgi:ribonuclease HI